VKCLTVRQPWAYLIVAGLKDVEFRSWATAYRGPLLIHAAARRPTPLECADYPRIDPARFVYSAILGVVSLVDCEDYGDGFGWVLRNPRRLERPFPCRGALSLWKPPAGIVLP
jgi:hypothetical protein